MRRAFSSEKRQGRECQEILQALQEQTRRAGSSRPWKRFSKPKVSVKLGRDKEESRRMSGQARQIDWRCGHCGCQDTNQCIRDGLPAQSLHTLGNRQRSLLKCQQHHHEMVGSFSILETDRRVWMDLNQAVLFESGVGQSLRYLQEQTHAQ